MLPECDNTYTLTEEGEAGQGGGLATPACFQSRQVRKGEADSHEGKWSLGLAGCALCIYEQESHTGVWSSTLFKASFHPVCDMNQISPWEKAHWLCCSACEQAGPERLSASLQGAQLTRPAPSLPPSEKLGDTMSPKATKGCPLGSAEQSERVRGPRVRLPGPRSCSHHP